MASDNTANDRPGGVWDQFLQERHAGGWTPSPVPAPPHGPVALPVEDELPLLVAEATVGLLMHLSEDGFAFYPAGAIEQELWTLRLLREAHLYRKRTQGSWPLASVLGRVRRTLICLAEGAANFDMQRLRDVELRAAAERRVRHAARAAKWWPWVRHGGAFVVSLLAVRKTNGWWRFAVGPVTFGFVEALGYAVEPLVLEDERFAVDCLSSVACLATPQLGPLVRPLARASSRRIGEAPAPPAYELWF
jgi:hypothetical protein